MDCVFLVAQSGDKGASRLVMSTRGTPECSPFGFFKQFLERLSKKSLEGS